MNLSRAIIWPPKYYHISDISCLTKLTPHIPLSAQFRINGENRSIRRVCFGPSVDMCLTGRRAHTKEKEFEKIVKYEDAYRYYVYESVEDFEPYIPTTRQVVDVQYTGEVWALRKVNVRQVGIIEVLRESNSALIPQVDGRTLIIPTYEWRWLADNSWTFGRMNGDCPADNS